MSKSIKIIITLLITIVVCVMIVGGVYIINLNKKISEQEKTIASLKSESSKEISSSKNEQDNNTTNSNEVIDNSIEENSNIANNVETNNVENNATQENENGEELSNDTNYVTVNREGIEEKVYMKKYVSALGYSMRYEPQIFSVTGRSGVDWYEQDSTINCIVVIKENSSFQEVTSKLNSTTKTKINGRDAVYTTNTAEGQFETEYYVDGGEGVTYIITTSYQDDSENAEGLAAIMSAMIQTFLVK